MDLLTLLEDGSRGHGRVAVLGEPTASQPVSEVWRRSYAVASWVEANSDSGQAVAGTMRSDINSLAALIGALRAGRTFVSVPPRPPTQQESRYNDWLRSMLAITGVALAVPDPTGAGLLNHLAGGNSLDNIVQGRTRARQLPEAGGSLVQFSSGSTGPPKGVEVSVEALGANVLAILDRLEVDDGDHCLSWLPLSHDMGLVGMALAALVAGSPGIANASLTLMQPESFMRSPGSWLRACSQVGATVTGSPPFGLRHSLRRVPAESTVSLNRLRAIIVGGDRVDALTLRRFGG